MITRPQIDSLLDRLADKSYEVHHLKSFKGTTLKECRNKSPDEEYAYPRGSQLEILGHPIYVHTVLERAFIEKVRHPDEYYPPELDGKGVWHGDILWKWTPCGITKSLQEIAEEIVWKEEAVTHQGTPKKGIVKTICGDYPTQVSGTSFSIVDAVKEGPQYDLFSYLLTVFPQS